MIWDHYRFTGDTSFLQANYPAMKGAAQFFLDTLVQEPTLGYLVTNPSNSPELAHHSGVSVCAGPTMDNQILRDLFNGVAQAERGARRRRRLPDQGPGHPRPAGPDEGRLARQHHGVALRLGGDRAATTGTSRTCTGCTPATRSPSAARPALYTAARRTLELRGDDGTGWSLAWKINYWARHGGGHARARPDPPAW